MARCPIMARCPKCGKVMELSSLPHYAFQCTDCDEDYLFFEARFDNEAAKDETLEAMWASLEDAPYDPETERFDRNVYGIGEDDEPLSRYDVWRWFDERHSHGVAYLMMEEATF